MTKMKKITTLGVAVGATFCLGLLAQADEIQFTTLPQPVQTMVIRETHITSPSSVTRVMRQDSGVYAVTVHRDIGDQVIYVNDVGSIVQEPGTTLVEKPAPATQETIVTYDQVQQDLSRYQLLEKKGKKEVYRDRQTGKKVKVEREKD
jgi:hypothetical protein